VLTDQIDASGSGTEPASRLSKLALELIRCALNQFIKAWAGFDHGKSVIGISAFIAEAGQ
jgi:hypothetical protein